MNENEMEEEVFSERIELKPKEKIELLIMDSFLQKQFDEFKSTELRPENIKEFLARVQQAVSDNLLSLNDIQMEKLESFTIHPEFNKYFKFIMEQKEKEKEKKTHQQEWFGLTRLDWMDNFTKLMKLERQFQPRNAMLYEILINAVEKLSSYIFSPQPSMERVGVPSFGKGRSELAYQLAKEGKSSLEIGEAIGKPTSSVWAYARRGAEKARDLEFLKRGKDEKVAGL